MRHEHESYPVSAPLALARPAGLDPADLLASLGGAAAATLHADALAGERAELERALARAPPPWLRHCAAERARREADDDRVAEISRELARVRLALRQAARQ